MKKLHTILGDLYVGVDTYGEVTLADSDKRVFFTFNDMNDNEVLEILNEVKNFTSIDDLYNLSFCNKIHSSDRMFDLLYDKNATFVSDDILEMTKEIYLIGNTFVKFDY